MRKRYQRSITYNLESGEIRHVQEWKDAAPLAGFRWELKRPKAPLKALVVDMSETYASAIREVYGGAMDLVHDPFHLTALPSKAIDETRRNLFWKLYGGEKKAIKGCCFLLLPDLENLKESVISQLMSLLEANEPLC